MVGRSSTWVKLAVVAVVGALGGGVFLFVASTGSEASGGVWTPAKSSVYIDSSNLSIKVGMLTIECVDVVGSGTLGAESATWTFTPHFDNCTKPVKAEAAWTANDVNSTEATLTIPTGKAMTIEAGPSCTVTVESGGTMGSAGDYATGVNGELEPSTLELAAQSVTIKSSGFECSSVICSGTSTAVFTANLSLLNYSNEEAAIKVS